MKPAAFLFDLDGTLVDTEALWTKAIVDFVVSRGGRTTYEEILPTVIGRNWLDIDRSLHERFPEIGESSAMEDAVELFFGHFGFGFGLFVVLEEVGVALDHDDGQNDRPEEGEEDDRNQPGKLVGDVIDRECSHSLSPWAMGV